MTACGGTLTVLVVALHNPTGILSLDSMLYKWRDRVIFTSVWIVDLLVA